MEFIIGWLVLAIVVSLIVGKCIKWGDEGLDGEDDE